MVTLLMQDNHEMRITMADLLSHPWWTSGPTATEEEFKARYNEVMNLTLNQNQPENIAYNA